MALPRMSRNHNRDEKVPRQLQRLPAMAIPPGATDQKPITVVPALTPRMGCPLSQIATRRSSIRGRMPCGMQRAKNWRRAPDQPVTAPEAQPALSWSANIKTLM